MIMELELFKVCCKPPNYNKYVKTKARKITVKLHTKSGGTLKVKATRTSVKEGEDK